MKLIFLFLATLFFVPISAQDSTAKQRRFKITYTPRHTPKDSIIPAGRNELYFNIAPVFSTLLGSIPDNEAIFSLCYKRPLKNQRWAMRTGILFRPQISNYYGDFNLNPDWYFDETDSTRIVNRFQPNNIHKWQLNVGMECRSKGNKRWSTFVGLDLISGFYKQSCVLYDMQEKLDSDGYWHIVDNSTTAVTMVDYKQSTSWYVGLSPKIGLRYAFNRHWMMSIQAGFDTYFLKSAYYKRDSFGTSILKYDANYFEYNMNSILDDFSIVYRF